MGSATLGRRSGPPSTPPSRPESSHRSSALKRAMVAGASAFVAVNIWTGAPLLALWVGSHLVSQTSLSMRGVAIVIAALATVVFTMTMLLSRLNQAYLDMVEAERGESEPSRIDPAGDGVGRRWAAFTPIERIVVASVYVAVITLLVWFFFFAGSPIPE